MDIFQLVPSKGSGNATEPDFDFALSIYLLIFFEFDDIDKISSIKSCSGEMTAKVIPNKVSGLVVKTSKFKSIS